MPSKPALLPLLQEHYPQQRSAIFTLLAADMRRVGASKHAIRTVLTGIDTYLKFTSTPSPNPPDPGSDQPQSSTDLDPTDNPPDQCLCLAQVTTQELTWLWQHRIPRGALTLLDGDPSSDPSLLAFHLAACISRGQPFPDGTPSTQGNVILIAPHDNIRHTLKPRLEAAGADPAHLFLLNAIECLDPRTGALRNRPFSLAKDLDTLEDTITYLHASLVILDTLETTRAHTLAALAQLAERTTCVILILRSLRKPHPSSSHDLLSAAARSRLLLTPDPNAPQHHLLTTTHALGPQPVTLFYELLTQEQGLPTIHWLDEQDQEPLTPSDEQDQKFLSFQRDYLHSVLRDSPVPLDARTVAQRTFHTYEGARKTLQRMLHAGQLVSPARGPYTTPDHPCLSQNINDPTSVSPQPSLLSTPHPELESTPVLPQAPVPIVPDTVGELPNNNEPNNVVGTRLIAPAECGLPNNDEPSDIVPVDPLFIVPVGMDGSNTTQFNSPTVPVPQVPNPNNEDDIPNHPKNE